MATAIVHTHKRSHRPPFPSVNAAFRMYGQNHSMRPSRGLAFSRSPACSDWILIFRSNAIRPADRLPIYRSPICFHCLRVYVHSIEYYNIIYTRDAHIIRIGVAITTCEKVHDCSRRALCLTCVRFWGAAAVDNLRSNQSPPSPTQHTHTPSTRMLPSPEQEHEHKHNNRIWCVSQSSYCMVGEHESALNRERLSLLSFGCLRYSCGHILRAAQRSSCSLAHLTTEITNNPHLICDTTFAKYSLRSQLPLVGLAWLYSWPVQLTAINVTRFGRPSRDRKRTRASSTLAATTLLTVL